MDNDTQQTEVDESRDGGRIRAKSTRRRFLGAGIVAALLPLLSGCTNYIMGYIVGGFGQASLSYFYPKKLSPFGSKIAVPGTVADYPVGSVTVIREGKFYLSHVPEGLLALYWKCKHLGCTVPWKPNEEFGGESGVFHCPCHGSIYLRSGQNVAGPAPKPLDIMEIEIAGGKITVNTKNITPRLRYEPTKDPVKV